MRRPARCEPVSIRTQLGGVDVLVNNAGIMLLAPSLPTSGSWIGRASELVAAPPGRADNGSPPVQGGGRERGPPSPRPRDYGRGPGTGAGDGGQFFALQAGDVSGDPAGLRCPESAPRQRARRPPSGGHIQSGAARAASLPRRICSDRGRSASLRDPTVTSAQWSRTPRPRLASYLPITPPREDRRRRLPGPRKPSASNPSASGTRLPRRCGAHPRHRVRQG